MIAKTGMRTNSHKNGKIAMPLSAVIMAEGPSIALAVFQNALSSRKGFNRWSKRENPEVKNHIVAVTIGRVSQSPQILPTITALVIRTATVTSRPKIGINKVSCNNIFRRLTRASLTSEALNEAKTKNAATQINVAACRAFKSYQSNIIPIPSPATQQPPHPCLHPRARG